jgi:predicted nucleic-acid-binding Zn-ribbon protein
MTKCFKCGGTEIAKGKIRRSSEEFFSDIVFGPEDIPFLTLTLKRGTRLQPESYACLTCGTVWSQTDPNALKDFMREHCKGPSNEKSTS